MTLVLDGGGVSALSGHRARLAALRERGLWPPMVPSVVLAEALTGDHRRDHDTNRLIKMCLVEPADEQLAREAAHLRTATGRAGEISAVDALVVAAAAEVAEPNILTSDPSDISALASHSDAPIAVTAT